MSDDLEMTNDYDLPESGTSNSTLAVVSLIAGILGVSFIPFLGSIVAVITGMMAKKEIRESSGTQEGEGLATAGIVLGWIGIGVTVIGLCLAGIVIVFSLCIMLFGVSSINWSSLLPFVISVL